MISHNKEFIFLHIPKCAGTSVNKTLKKYCENTFENSKKSEYAKHAKLPVIRKAIGEKRFNEYHKFTIVRNPWDRILSLYFWGLNVKPHKGIQKSWKKEEDFNSWLINKFIKEDYFKLWGNQIDLMKINGVRSIDRIIRFENLKDDWTKLCDHLKIEDDLQHIYKSGHKPYYEYYDKKSIDLVRDIYIKDIKKFNYEFKK